jgi:hypothetical protein
MKTVHLSRIDLNLFVVFDAIYTEGGITRASKRLSLTQPAISHALGRLRELFDDPLFIRQGKAMIPTPLARVMIDPVRDSLQGRATLVTPFDPATARKLSQGARNAPVCCEPSRAPRRSSTSRRARRTQARDRLAAGTLTRRSFAWHCR